MRIRVSFMENWAPDHINFLFLCGLIKVFSYKARLIILKPVEIDAERCSVPEHQNCLLLLWRHRKACYVFPFEGMCFRTYDTKPELNDLLIDMEKKIFPGDGGKNCDSHYKQAYTKGNQRYEDWYILMAQQEVRNEDIHSGREA